MIESPLMVLKEHKFNMYYVGTLRRQENGIWVAFHNFNEGYECKYKLHNTFSEAMEQLYVMNTIQFKEEK